MELQQLLEIAAKLRNDEPLDRDEALHAAEVIHMVARGVNPIPLYHEPVIGRPENPNGYYIALHYLLEGDVAAVADAWHYAEDSNKVQAFARKHRAECEAEIRLMTPATRERWIRDLRAMARVSKKR